MSSLRRMEEEEAEDAEITLTTASLLGIFFGLVLVCAVFFGFGYSLGRGGSHAAPVSATDAADNADQPSSAQASRQPLPSLQQQDDTPAAAPADSMAARSQPETVTLPISASDGETTAEATPDSGADAEEASIPKPVDAPKAPAHLAAARTRIADQATAATGKTMVQIAAVSRQEDADALVSALRQRGFSVAVRGEPQDKLLHVQVGPFPNRVEANLMKQKLLSSGYNAIIKQ